MVFGNETLGNTSRYLMCMSALYSACCHFCQCFTLDYCYTQPQLRVQVGLNRPMICLTMHALTNVIARDDVRLIQCMSVALWSTLLIITLILSLLMPVVQWRLHVYTGAVRVIINSRVLTHLCYGTPAARSTCSKYIHAFTMAVNASCGRGHCTLRLL